MQTTDKLEVNPAEKGEEHYRNIAKALLPGVLDRVANEVEKAMMKHRPMYSAHEGHSVIREELDELWEEVRADTGTSVDASKEAAQIAAMGIRYLIDVYYGANRAYKF